MTCDQCPDVLPCWQGLLNRRPCHYCGRVEIHIPGTLEQPTPGHVWAGAKTEVDVLVRSCPVDAPAPPPSNRYNRVICDRCRVARQFSVKRSYPGARSYTYEE